MKKIIPIVMLLALGAAAASAQDGSAATGLPRIAVYVTGGVPNNEKSALGTRMLASLVRSGRYTAVERSNMFLAEVEKEQMKQRSGAVDDSQIRELGKMFGVTYVCIAAITPAFGTFQVSARIVNVETAAVAFIGESYSMLQSADDLKQVCDEVVNSMFSVETGSELPEPKTAAQEPQTIVKTAKANKPATRRAVAVKQTPATAQPPITDKPPIVSQEPPQWQQETLKPEAPAAQEPQSAEKTAKASDASVKTRRMFAVKLLPVNAPPPVASPDTQESQEIPEQDYTPIAEKTLFVDVAPIVVGLTPGIIGKIFGGGELGGLGFGIGVQYERRLLEEFSLMGRFDYIGVTTMTLFNEKQIYHMSNISFEMHARIYQSVHHGSAFFFGGYVGAGFAEIDSDVDVEFDYYSKSKYKATASRLYLKLGPSFGYRNMFGKSGKFSYETSFGYRIAFMGEPLAKQVTDVAADNDLYFTENLWRNVENFIIIGGPRLVVAFGYSF